LVPANQLFDFWPSVNQQPERFQAIARHFKVSELVSVRRAMDLGLITRSEFSDFYRNYQEKQRCAAAQGQDGGNFYATQNLRIGRRFAEMVIRAAREGKILYRDAYRLTGLHGKTFEQYANSIINGDTT